MAIIFSKAEKYQEVAVSLRRISPPIIKLIWFGLILLIISGIALPYYITWPLDKQMLLIKHTLVAWVVIIGFILGFTSRKINLLAPKPKEKPSFKFIKMKKLMKIFSMINLILWYIITFISSFV